MLGVYGNPSLGKLTLVMSFSNNYRPYWVVHIFISYKTTRYKSMFIGIWNVRWGV